MAFDKVLRVDAATFDKVKAHSLAQGVALSQAACDLLSGPQSNLYTDELEAERNRLRQDYEASQAEVDSLRERVRDQDEQLGKVRAIQEEVRKLEAVHSEREKKAHTRIVELETEQAELHRELARLRDQVDPLQEGEGAEADAPPVKLDYPVSLLDDGGLGAFISEYKPDLEARQKTLVKTKMRAVSLVAALLDVARIGIVRLRATTKYAATK